MIWDYSGSLLGSPNGTGPTGNGFNEIIFLQNRALVGAPAMASMDLDPVTGAILECDVIFDVNTFVYFPGVPGGVLPNQTTAYVHEIGHFFGLDHTNLHPGNPQIGNVFPSAVSPTSSWMGYTSGPALVPTEYPGMMGGITYFPGSNMVARRPSSR